MKMTKRISRNIVRLTFITMLVVNVITPIKSYASSSTNSKVTINNPKLSITITK